jgi:hypothetical protein
MIDAFKISKFRDHFSIGIQHHNFIGLIRHYPDVVRLVGDEAVCAVDAVSQYCRRAGFSASHRNSDHRIVAGVRDQQRGASTVERKAIGAERRFANGRKQRIGQPRSCDSARRTGAPNRPLKGIGDVHIPAAIEGERVRTLPTRPPIRSGGPRPACPVRGRSCPIATLPIVRFRMLRRRRLESCGRLSQRLLRRLRLLHCRSEALWRTHNCPRNLLFAYTLVSSERFARRYVI